VTGA
jgi:hypothetical protein